MLLMQKNVSPNQSDGTLKNVHNEKEIKKLKNYMEETAEYQTLLLQQDVKYM